MNFVLKMRNLMSHCLECHQRLTFRMIHFCDLDLNLKVKSQLPDVKFHLKMKYFFNPVMDIHQTYMDIQL